MTIDKGYKRGLAIALLFGAGMTVTITAYGFALALLGKTTGLNEVSAILMLAAGVISFVFGLNRLHLINIRTPSYSGTPKFMLDLGDYSKAGIMGLLVGNAGVGCTNPLFYIILIHIMGTGSTEIGMSLGFVHGIGRAIPLILVATLAIIGFNPTRSILSKRAKIEKMSGFVMIVLGAFLIVNGTPEGQQWFMNVFLHTVWNDFVKNTNLPEQFMISMLPTSGKEISADAPSDHSHRQAEEKEMRTLTSKKDYILHFWWEPKGILEKDNDVTFNIMFHNSKTNVLIKDITYDIEIYQNGNLIESREGIYTLIGYDKQNFRFHNSGDAYAVIKKINGQDTEGKFSFKVDEPTGKTSIMHDVAPRYPPELTPVFIVVLIVFPIIWYTIKNRHVRINS
jgi:cytochrome c biogenesis protein CcdA